ncbi:hypothetical protein [Mediterraneibacter massiliensis]|uniref:hypothetical protein n=1 Tax=Mediterraneibacter massiliensis TaxID=1720300 RepID=UPI00073F45C5|nr:hypothetical protein [Mediterraneibacter massiliensis]
MIVYTSCRERTLESEKKAAHSRKGEEKEKPEQRQRKIKKFLTTGNEFGKIKKLSLKSETKHLDN